MRNFFTQRKLQDLLIKIYSYTVIFSKTFWLVMAVNFSAIVFQFLYIYLRFPFINQQIPFFYTQPWGDPQLAPKASLYLIPTTLMLFLPLVAFFYAAAKRYYLMYAGRLVLGGLSFVNLVMLASVLRIISIASNPFGPLIENIFVLMLLVFFSAYIVVGLITPKFIELFRKHDIVTNPEIHWHPSMLLQQPTVRGGGIVFAAVFIALGLLYSGASTILWGIYLGTAAIAVLGLLDDYQNTHPGSALKHLENPILRLVILSFLVMIPIAFGVRIDFINNPFNGIINFEALTISIAGTTIYIASIAFTVLWFVWVLNVLSWSNGVNGQYCGIIGIACIVIAILALRFTPVQEIHMDIAKLAMIAAGASFGLARYTWDPSKIMWGFGAMAAGLVIATSSVVIGSKIATSIIIILIPFLDAVVTFGRRTLQRKNPLKGDRGHLHHLLLDKGWSVKKIALFYWATTAIFGVVGIVSANVDMLLVTLTIIGFVASFIIVLNVDSILGKKLK
jgi:UDP-GlcNAc:undecaprenyl-phosphate/decaprenyl-phosphate GlcNAc-1-phosphate transferase